MMIERNHNRSGLSYGKKMKKGRLNMGHKIGQEPISQFLKEFDVPFYVMVDWFLMKKLSSVVTAESHREAESHRSQLSVNANN